MLLCSIILIQLVSGLLIKLASIFLGDHLPVKNGWCQALCYTPHEKMWCAAADPLAARASGFRLAQKINFR